MIRITACLLLLLTTTGCTLQPLTPEQQEFTRTMLLYSVMSPRPTLQPHLNCYSTGAQGGVIATCY
jgi:hypothetical protein